MCTEPWIRVQSASSKETSNLPNSCPKSSSDFVLFIWSSHVGKQGYQECAERLLPHALRVGRSCATIVNGTFDLDLAAVSIAWRMFTNGEFLVICPVDTLFSPRII